MGAIGYALVAKFDFAGNTDQTPFCAGGNDHRLRRKLAAVGGDLQDIVLVDVFHFHFVH